MAVEHARFERKIPYDEAKKEVLYGLKDFLLVPRLHSFCKAQGFPLEVLKDEDVVLEARKVLLGIEQLIGAIHQPEHAAHKDFDPTKFTALNNARRLIIDVFGDQGISRIDFRIINKRLSKKQISLIEKLPVLQRAQAYKSIERWLAEDETREMADDLLQKIIARLSEEGESGQRNKNAYKTHLNDDNDPTTVFLRESDLTNL